MADNDTAIRSAQRADLLSLTRLLIHVAST